MRFLANLIGFNVVWFALVIGAANGMWWAGLVALVVFAIATIATSPWPRTDARLMAVALAMGVVFETALVQFGILRFDSPVPWPAFAPIWMLGLWANFALSINHSLGFLSGRMALAAALGAVAGPLAYWSAASVFGAADLIAPVAVAMGVLAVAYGLATPAMAELARRWRTAEEAGRASPTP